MDTSLLTLTEDSGKMNTKKEVYPGVCNLCYSSSEEHATLDCPFSTSLYHATNFRNLSSILQNGLNPNAGRLGSAVYCSNQPETCYNFVQKNHIKFQKPIILKIKAMLTQIKSIDSPSELKLKYTQFFKKQKVQCVKCPYYKVGDKILYEYALYKTDYLVVGYSPINIPNREDFSRGKVIEKAAHRILEQQIGKIDKIQIQENSSSLPDKPKQDIPTSQIAKDSIKQKNVKKHGKNKKIKKSLVKLQ